MDFDPFVQQNIFVIIFFACWPMLKVEIRREQANFAEIAVGWPTVHSLTVSHAEWRTFGTKASPSPHCGRTPCRVCGAPNA